MDKFLTQNSNSSANQTPTLATIKVFSINFIVQFQTQLIREKIKEQAMKQQNAQSRQPLFRQISSSHSSKKSVSYKSHTSSQTPKTKPQTPTNNWLYTMKLNLHRKRLIAEYFQIRDQFRAITDRFSLRDLYDLTKIKKPSKELLKITQYLCSIIQACRNINKQNKVKLNTWQDISLFLTSRAKILHEIKKIQTSIEEETLNMQKLKDITGQILQDKDIIKREKCILKEFIITASQYFRVQSEIIDENSFNISPRTMKGHLRQNSDSIDMKKQTNGHQKFIQKRQSIDVKPLKPILQSENKIILNNLQAYNYKEDPKASKENVVVNERDKIISIDLSNHNSSYLNYQPPIITLQNPVSPLRQSNKTNQQPNNFMEQQNFKQQQQDQEPIYQTFGIKMQKIHCNQNQINDRNYQGQNEQKVLSNKKQFFYEQLPAQKKKVLFNSTQIIDSWNKQLNKGFISPNKELKTEPLIINKNFINKREQNRNHKVSQSYDFKQSRSQPIQQYQSINQFKIQPQSTQESLKSQHYQLQQKSINSVQPSTKRLSDNLEEIRKREKSLELELKREYLIQQLTKTLLQEKRLQQKIQEQELSNRSSQR